MNASSAHTKLRATLRGDEIFEPLHRHTFLSGSYKRDTAIRPRIKNGNAQRPDVDIIVVTNHELYDDPVDVVDAIHAACPNSFLFYPGQNHQGFGPVVVYEFDFDRQGNKTYQPSFVIG